MGDQFRNTTTDSRLFVVSLVAFLFGLFFFPQVTIPALAFVAVVAWMINRARNRRLNNMSDADLDRHVSNWQKGIDARDGVRAANSTSQVDG